MSQANISQWINRLDSLRANLVTMRDAAVAAKQRNPELAPVLDPIIAELERQLPLLDQAAQNAAQTVTVSLAELLDLPKSGLKPLPHAGTVTGG